MFSILVNKNGFVSLECVSFLTGEKSRQVKTQLVAWWGDWIKGMLEETEFESLSKYSAAPVIQLHWPAWLLVTAATTAGSQAPGFSVTFHLWLQRILFSLKGCFCHLATVCSGALSTTFFLMRHLVKWQRESSLFDGQALQPCCCLVTGRC